MRVAKAGTKREYNIAAVVILALETVTRAGSVAIFDNGHVKAAIGQGSERHGTRLPGEVVAFLSDPASYPTPPEEATPPVPVLPPVEVPPSPVSVSVSPVSTSGITISGLGHPDHVFDETDEGTKEYFEWNSIDLVAQYGGDRMADTASVSRTSSRA